VGAALLTWWPAFTLGAFGVIFFDQLLRLWVVSTAVILCVLLLPGRSLVTGRQLAVLALPSVWIVTSMATSGWRESLLGGALAVVNGVITLALAPFLVWLLLRLLAAEYVSLPFRTRWGVVAVTVAVTAAAFALGKLNGLFLTCHDFTVSGNDTPPGCALGKSSIADWMPTLESRPITES
jgi:hypothetical protein